MKNKYLIISFIFFCALTNLFAQKSGQDLIDSLLIELPKVIDDTNKVNLLNEISFGYYIIFPETGLEYAKQALELSKKLNWKLGQAYSYNSLMQNYWAVGDFDLAIDMYNITVKIENELGLNKKIKESSLTSINRTFTYPTSENTNLTNEIRKYLKEVAMYMKDNPLTVIAITGHSDNFGTFEQNDTRAKERADHVVDFLVKEGIAKRRLLANHKGALDPVAKNDTEQGRKKNRRVEIREIK